MGVPNRILRVKPGGGLVSALIQMGGGGDEGGDGGAELPKSIKAFDEYVRETVDPFVAAGKVLLHKPTHSRHTHAHVHACQFLLSRVLNTTSPTGAPSRVAHPLTHLPVLRCLRPRSPTSHLHTVGPGL